jgi:hypothetical protein
MFGIFHYQHFLRSLSPQPVQYTVIPSYRHTVTLSHSHTVTQSHRTPITQSPITHLENFVGVPLEGVNALVGFP